MKGKHYIFLAVFVIGFIGQKVQAQARQVVLIIDTLRQSESQGVLKKMPIRLVTHEEDERISVESEGAVDRSRFPNYTTTFQISNEKTVIELPIDQKLSHIELEGFALLDTIRISKLEIFQTQPPNETKTLISSYIVRKGEFVEIPTKIRHKNKVDKMQPPPAQVKLLINGEKYTCSLKLEKSPVTINTTGHAYRPQLGFRKKDVAKRRVVYQHIGSETTIFYWKGVVVKKAS